MATGQPVGDDCGGAPAHTESTGPTSTAALACVLGSAATEVAGLGVAATSAADQAAIRSRTLRMNWAVIAGIVG